MNNAGVGVIVWVTDPKPISYEEVFVVTENYPLMGIVSSLIFNLTLTVIRVVDEHAELEQTLKRLFVEGPIQIVVT